MTEERIEKMFAGEWKAGMCDFCCDTNEWIATAEDKRICRHCLEHGQLDALFVNDQGISQISGREFQNAIFEHLKDAEALCQPSTGCLYCATRADELREEQKAYETEIACDFAMQENGHWDFDMREAQPPTLFPVAF